MTIKSNQLLPCLWPGEPAKYPGHLPLAKSTMIKGGCAWQPLHFFEFESLSLS